MSITTWNRLECDVVFDDPARGLDRGLAAELSDPLWLLARQGQMGEFRAEDGGSLVHAAVSSASFPVRTITIAGHPAPLDPAAPLESVVEREPAAEDLRLRIRGGLMLAELLSESNLDRLRQLLPGKYPFGPPLGDPDARALFGLAVQQAADGAKIRQAQEAGHLAGDLEVRTEESARFDKVVKGWLAWYRPRAAAHAPDAWVPDRLEHRFSLAAPAAGGTVTLEAPEYPGGRLDWDAFTVTGVAGAAGAPQPRAIEALPLPVEIPGMPVVRYWEIEDPRFDVGRVSVGPGDAGRLLMVEFALTFASDWFLVPVPAPVGALVTIANVVVTDTFGVARRIRSARQIRPDPSWALWQLTDASGPQHAPEFLFIPPPPAGGLEGEPVEEVALVLDELANLAWGIEATVPAALGGGRPVDRRSPIPPPPPSPAERVYVPFPALPADRAPMARVDRPDGTYLARARVVEEQAAVAPTEGRLLTPAFRVRDEEVGVDGIALTRRFQLARGQDGRRYLWISRAKRPGATRPGRRVAFDALGEPG